MKKFFSVVLVFCLILGLATASMAAAKKSARKKSASRQGDKIEQILKSYKPVNSTNAKVIRDVLKKYGGEHILAITSGMGKRGFDLTLELVSVKTGAKQRVKAKVTKDFPLYYDDTNEDEQLSYYEWLDYCIVTFNANAKELSFADESYNLTTSYDDNSLLGFGDFLELLSKNNYFGHGNTSFDRNTATLPFILIYK